MFFRCWLGRWTRPSEAATVTLTSQGAGAAQAQPPHEAGSWACWRGGAASRGLNGLYGKATADRRLMVRARISRSRTSVFIRARSASMMTMELQNCGEPRATVVRQATRRLSGRAPQRRRVLGRPVDATRRLSCLN